MVRKKKGRLISKEKQAHHKKSSDVSISVFSWHSEKHKKLFRYHFHYFLVSSQPAHNVLRTSANVPTLVKTSQTIIRPK